MQRKEKPCNSLVIQILVDNQERQTWLICPTKFHRDHLCKNEIIKTAYPIINYEKLSRSCWESSSGSSHPCLVTVNESWFHKAVLNSPYIKAPLTKASWNAFWALSIQLWRAALTGNHIILQYQSQVNNYNIIRYAAFLRGGKQELCL